MDTAYPIHSVWIAEDGGLRVVENEVLNIFIPPNITNSVMIRAGGLEQILNGLYKDIWIPKDRKEESRPVFINANEIYGYKNTIAEYDEVPKSNIYIKINGQYIGTKGMYIKINNTFKDITKIQILNQ